MNAQLLTRVFTFLTITLKLMMVAWSQDVGAPAPGQPKATNPAVTGAVGKTQMYDPYNIGRTPWFSNPDLRRELKLTDESYDRLNKAYLDSWTRYNKAVAGLKPGLSAEERLARRRELYNSFYSDFTPRYHEIVTDRALSDRHQQLYWQYRGYGAFDDPALQKRLHLSGEQMRQLGGYHKGWNSDMITLGRDYADPRRREAATRAFNDSRALFNERINSTLTPEQLTEWNQITGKHYSIPADVYFGSPNPPTTGAVRGTGIGTTPAGGATSVPK